MKALLPSPYGELLVLAIATLITYANALSGPFVFDDIPSIVENEDIRHITPLWQSAENAHYPPVNSRPITRLSLAINYALDGYHIRYYRAFNIAIHLACATVLFALLQRLWSAYIPAASHWACAAALLWAVHPLNSQCVNYIAQRSESLMALFYLLLLYFLHDTSRRATLAAILCCALGTMSKEVMITAPVVALLYDRAFISGSLHAALARRPLLYGGLACSWLLCAALLAAQPHAASAGFCLTIGPIQYLLNQFLIIPDYLGKIFWPKPLLLDYGYPQLLTWSDIAPQALFVCALIAASLALSWRYPASGFVGLFFFAVLTPTSSIIPIANEVGAERRIYLPMAALVAAIVWGVYTSWEHGEKKARARVQQKATTPRAWQLAIAILVAILALQTRARNRVFSDEVQLWRSNITAMPTNARAHNNLGLALAASGDMQTAAEHYRRALDLAPDFVMAHINLGLVLAAAKQYEQAISHYKRALNLQPNNVDALVDLGITLEKIGQRQSAIDHYRRALASAPHLAAIHYNLATALDAAGQHLPAIDHYRSALIIDPNLDQAHLRLAHLLARDRQWEAALAHYERAAHLQPDSAEAQFAMGNALRALQKVERAMACYQRALAIDSHLVEAHYNIGTMLLHAGQTRAAIDAYRHALTLRPQWPQAHYNLGVALQREKQLDAAIAQFRRALELQPNYTDARHNLNALLSLLERE